MSRRPVSSPSRRSFLRGLMGGATVTVGLPILHAHLDGFLPGGPVAHATTATGLPRCFGQFYWANGSLPTRFKPVGAGTGDAWQLSDQLAPLQRHKSKLSIVSNLAVRQPNINPHGSGTAGFLCGMVASGTPSSSPLPDATIDQLIANEIGANTRFRSLEFGADAAGGLSYSGPNLQLPAESDPYALFQRVFGAGFTLPGEEPIIDPAWALRRSVLDAVVADANRLQKRLGAADRQRLDAHLTAVRELETRLARLEDAPPDLAACALPEEPNASYPPIDGRPQLIEVNRLMSQIAAMALACDQTRVVSNYFSHPVSNVLHPGAPDGHHNLTHDEADPQDAVHDIIVRSMGAMGDMLDALDAIEEIDGKTLLDRCAVVGWTEIGLGRVHSLTEMPFVLAGSAGDRLVMDTHIEANTSESTTKPLLTVARAVGAELTSFGTDDAFTDAGLSELQS